MRVLFCRLLSLATVALLTPSLTLAQGSAVATITGQVTDRTTQSPVPSVQVVLAGTTRGALTGEDGRFRIGAVPAGTYDVRAARIGYETQTRSVTLQAGANVTVDFALTATAVRIDEVRVTATGQTERKRESGVTTATIDTSQVNLAAVQNLSQVLSARAAGVTVQQSSGTAGMGSRIRIRGSNSVSLTNDPLVIVDGIRIHAAQAQAFLGDPNAAPGFGVGGQLPSRLDDLNTEDIENIEVIKGPSAAALYGTAGANGVIQITTKKGRAGKTVYNAYAEYGTLKDPTNYPANFGRIGTSTADGSRVNCSLETQVLGGCIPKADSIVTTSPLENASPFVDSYRQMIGVSAAGGTQAATFFVSGDVEREQSVLIGNSLRKYNFRGNFRGQLRDNWDVTVNSGYVSSRLGLPQGDNNGFGLISGALLGKAFDCHTGGIRTPANPGGRDPLCGTDSLGRGYFTANHPSRVLAHIDSDQNIERFIGSINSNWQALSWLGFMVTGGLDVLNRDNEQTLAPGLILTNSTNANGFRQADRARIRTYSLQGSSTAAWSPFERIRATTTVGVQYNREALNQVQAQGQSLLAGTGSLSGTSTLFAVGEQNSDVVTIGAFAQQQVAWNDRVFLTAAIRGDDNSAFGTDFGFITYPAFSASWVIGEESFFPANRYLSSLRLRAAYGESGQRPQFRQASPFFAPVTASVNNVDATAVTLGGAGNALLEPEISREWEFGADLGFWDDRLSLEVTHYDKTTDAAIVNRRLAPSLGATLTRPENIGQVKNSGWEFLLAGSPVNADRFKWDITLNGSTNKNRVIDLGEGVTPIIFGLGGNTQRIQNDYPLGGYWARRLIGFEDKNGDGILSRVGCATTLAQNTAACEVFITDTAEFQGTPFPKREFSIANTLTLFRYFRVSALLDHKGGHHLQNHTRRFRCASTLQCRETYDPSAPLEDQARAVATRLGGYAYFEKADFWKLREVAFTVVAPQSWVRRLRTDAVSFTIAGRNLRTWTDYTGFDPEALQSAAQDFNTADFLTVPQPRMWTGRINVTF
ncbi:MAG TPA: SusC/RagA family TonB-linked outer membrane protein [Gemmatimonadaceae bacterium]|nr:SusC/RagA family TonB-linked outer membrane protein [Gemmatimonadaceae bacterium]